MFGRYTIDGYFLLVCEVLVLLASGTSFDIVGYPLVHVRPPVPFFSFADGFVSTRMASCGVVMN